jgi:phosphohistidine phosphatase
MNIFLVQHGRARTKKEDSTRPLIAAGVKASEKVARWLAAADIEVDEIRHSGKKRAEQTGLIFAGQLAPARELKAVSGLNPMDDVRPIAGELRGVQDSLMLIGHLPFMSRLVGLLVAGDPEKEVVRFQNSGVVCLQEDEGQWHIEWMIVPDLISE